MRATTEIASPWRRYLFVAVVAALGLIAVVWTTVLPRGEAVPASGRRQVGTERDEQMIEVTVAVERELEPHAPVRSWRSRQLLERLR